MNSFAKLGEFGATWASGQGDSIHVDEIETDYRGTQGTLGGATISFSFTANIDGANSTKTNGTSTGGLWIDIVWDDQTMGETIFNSGCVAELETRYQPNATCGIGEFEGEYEGGIKNFPQFPNTIKASVGSIQVLQDPDNAGKVEVDFKVDLGYTCEEEIYPGKTDIEFEKIALKNLNPNKFYVNNNGNHGRESFPDTYTARTCVR